MDVLEPIATALAALAAIGSFVVAWRVWKSQEKLTIKSNDLHDKANQIFTDLRTSTKQTQDEANNLRQRTNELQEAANELQDRISKTDRLLTQRAQLVPLWHYWSQVSHINPESPAQIIDTVNTLELVALCWEAHIVDPEIIESTFADTFIEIYEEIDKCQDVELSDGVRKSGRQLLRENRATIRLYDELRKKQTARGRVAGLSP
jgi:uncharacterized membrane protein YccC